MQQKTDLDKILLNFLILFTPLVIGRFGLSFSEFPKSVFFRSLTEVIFISYLILLIRGGRQYLPKVKGRLLFFAVLGFMGVLVLGTLFSINPYWSFWGTIGRSQGLVTYLHFFAFFIVLISTVKAKKDWIFFLQWSVFVSGISSFAGILQKLNIVSFYGVSLPNRISGTLANPDFFGSYLVLNIFLGLFLLSLKDKTKDVRVALVAITALNVLTLFLSGHRAGWVGAAVGFVFLGVVWFWRYSHQNKKLKRAFIYGALVLGILTSLLFLNQERLRSSDSYLLQRVASLADIESALEERLVIWRAGFEGWKEKPLLGWGLETFSFSYDKHITWEGAFKIASNVIYDRPHNKILGLASDVGVLGVVSYLLIFSSIFYLIFKHRKRWGPIPSLILSSLFIAYFVQNLGGFDTISSLVIFFLLLGFVDSSFTGEKDSRVGKTRKPTNRLSNPLAGTIFKFLAILLALLSVAVFYTHNLPILQAGLGVIRARDLEKRNLSASLAGYREISQKKMVLALDFRWEIIERLLFMLRDKGTEGFRKEIVKIILDLVPLLEKDLEKPLKGYLRKHVVLSEVYETIYLISGNPEALDKVEETARKMRNFNEEYPDTYWHLGKAQLYRGNYEEAEAVIQKAFELGYAFETRYRVLQYANLYGTYLYVGDKAKAGEYLAKAVDAIHSFVLTRFPDNLRPEDLEWLISQQPLVDASAQFHLIELNDSKTAIELYEKAIFIYPIYKEVIQKKIDDLKEEF